MKTSGSLFSGCGGADCGMKQAGYINIFGVEYHQPAADIYNLNHANPVTVADILDVDSIPTVDLLWASPPCPSYSQANPNRGETDRDIKLAKHIARLMVESRPRSIAIENVRGYAGSQSLSIIWAALDRAGYRIDDGIYNAANYGAPTTRSRWILRATLDRLGEVKATHRSPRRVEHNYKQLPLFGFEPLPVWVSWWEAIEDRIEELPRSELTENQIRAISGMEIPVEAKLGWGEKLQIRTNIDLSAPVAASVHTGIPTARQRNLEIPASFSIRLLAERAGYFDVPNIYADLDRPAPTIRAHTHVDDKGSYRVAYNIVDNYDCYAADIKCLAAWQGFPRDNLWGDNKGEAGRAIGNSVPPPLAEAIAKSFLR